MTQIKNRRLSAWIGSILFHTVVLFLILFWFSLPSANRDAPGDRFAIGIIVESGGGTQQQATTSPTDSHIADSELLEFVAKRFANPILALGREHGGGSPGEVAGELSEIPGGGIGAGRATTHVFGLGGEGRRFVYVFDRSASMDGRPMQMAKTELIRSLGVLDDSHQFNIIFYNHELERWQPRLTHATPVNKQNALHFIQSITAIGGTQHYRPLIEAINHRPDVIFFLTDGVEGLELTPGHLASIRRANSQGVQINVIEFGRGGFFERESPLLRQLATENHGEYLYRNVMRGL